MIDDQILMGYLDNAVAKAKAYLKENGHLDDKHATSLMLKSQFNHISHMEGHIKHLEDNMVTKEIFNLKIGVLEQGLRGEIGTLDGKIGMLGSRMTFIQWFMAIGFGALALLISVATNLISF